MYFLNVKLLLFTYINIIIITKSCSESCHLKIVNIFLNACGFILFFCIKISMSLSNTELSHVQDP